jgi:hypothetical protein
LIGDIALKGILISFGIGGEVAVLVIVVAQIISMCGICLLCAPSTGNQIKQKQSQ